jgi:hypothetical protein
MMASLVSEPAGLTPVPGHGLTSGLGTRRLSGQDAARAGPVVRDRGGSPRCQCEPKFTPP